MTTNHKLNEIIISEMWKDTQQYVLFFQNQYSFAVLLVYLFLIET